MSLVLSFWKRKFAGCLKDSIWWDFGFRVYLLIFRKDFQDQFQAKIFVLAIFELFDQSNIHRWPTHLLSVSEKVKISGNLYWWLWNKLIRGPISKNVTGRSLKISLSLFILFSFFLSLFSNLMMILFSGIYAHPPPKWQ